MSRCLRRHVSGGRFRQSLCRDGDAPAARCFYDQYHVPIYVRLQHNRLGRYAASTEVMIPIADRLKGFGTLESLLSREILVGATIDKLARAWHDEYRKTLPPERHDAPANRPWAELPEFYKMSNRRACDHLPIKLARAGLRMEEISDSKSFDLKRKDAKDPVVSEFTREEANLLAQLEHRRWFIERRMLGSVGPKRSEGQRLNPLLVEWDKLPGPIERRARNCGLPRLAEPAISCGAWCHSRVRRQLAGADTTMDEAEAHANAAPRRSRRNSRPEGFAIAERASIFKHELVACVI